MPLDVSTSIAKVQSYRVTQRQQCVSIRIEKQPRQSVTPHPRFSHDIIQKIMLPANQTMVFQDQRERIARRKLHLVCSRVWLLARFELCFLRVVTLQGSVSQKCLTS